MQILANFPRIGSHAFSPAFNADSVGQCGIAKDSIFPKWFPSCIGHFQGSSITAKNAIWSVKAYTETLLARDVRGLTTPATTKWLTSIQIVIAVSLIVDAPVTGPQRTQASNT